RQDYDISIIPVRRYQRTERVIGLLRDRALCAFVDSDEHVATGNNAALRQRAPARVGDDCGADATFVEELSKRHGLNVFPDHANECRLRTECGCVHGCVRRTARCADPALKIDDGDGRFLRQPLGRPAKVPVEHRITDDEDVHLVKCSDQEPDAWPHARAPLAVSKAAASAQTMKRAASASPPAMWSGMRSSSLCHSVSLPLAIRMVRIPARRPASTSSR